MNISISSWKNYTPLTLLLITAAVFIIPKVVIAWQVNAWSLDFSRAALEIKSGVEGYTGVPPAGHQRASFWLARQALAAGNPLEAQTLIKELTEEGNQDALIIEGDALAAAGEFPGAVQVWQKAGVYAVLAQAALRARENGQIENAILAGQAAWQIDPDLGTLTLATFLSDIGDLESAKALVQNVMYEYPNSTQRQGWLLRLGTISRTQKDWQDAVHYYTQALDEQPQSIPAQIGLGWVYYEMGDGIEAALKQFQLVIAKEPEKGQGYLAMGQVLFRERSYQEAVIWFAKAVKLNPENHWWMLAQANNLRAAGNLSEAMHLYIEMMERYPDWAQVYYEMAWANRLENLPDEAVWMMEQALVLQDPQKFGYFWRAGIIYEWAERPDMALTVYRQALTLAPENQAVKEAIKRMININ